LGILSYFDPFARPSKKEEVTLPDDIESGAKGLDSASNKKKKKRTVSLKTEQKKDWYERKFPLEVQNCIKSLINSDQ